MSKAFREAAPRPRPSFAAGWKIFYLETCKAVGSDHGSLRAFAKVKLGCRIVHGCRVVQQEGQKAWVALPQQPARRRADGRGSGWYPIHEITSPKVFDELRRAVLDARQAKADQPAEPGRTVVHRFKPRNPRQDHIDDLAKRVDARGPDRVEDIF